jgi:hypothetical protein
MHNFNGIGNLNIDGNLTTKNSRTAWEDAFMTTYLNPVLSVSFYTSHACMIRYSLGPVYEFVCDSFRTGNLNCFRVK